MAREQLPLSLILCDLDWFKAYNDTYGHQGGDRCLQAVAQAIATVLKRPADLLARYGGEEFVVILPNTPLAGAQYIAAAIQTAVKNLQLPHAGSPIAQHITLSLGIASVIPYHEHDPALLITAADQALYAAKAQGRDRAVAADPIPNLDHYPPIL
jgi:diguanylate cyclase (GGDEF)-like protein